MDQFLQRVLNVVSVARDWIWGNWMIALLVGTGVVLTLRTGGVQFRLFVQSMKLLLRGAFGKEPAKEEKGDISPYAALMTALAATVGNGNIAGVAAAIATGGPGAPFWMWMSGIFGMATKYAEGFLGVYFRREAEDGSMAGGPMYYCRYGLKDTRFARGLGWAFALFGGFACLLGTGNMAQSNSMALAVDAAFKEHGVAGGCPFWISGLVITVLVGLVVIGGIKRIGAVAEKLVPTMIAIYFIGVIIVLGAYWREIPAAFETIFGFAFSLKAAVGGVIGISVQRAISLGVSRGVLSNEAGLGSAAIAQSASRSSDPTDNGLMAMTGVFIDTIVVNTLTTLLIVVTGVWKLTPVMGGELTSTALTASAMSTVIPSGSLIIAVCSFLFGYTTLIGWCYYGEICWEYIFGIRIVLPYRFIYITLLFVGAVVQGPFINIVWFVGEAANAFMAFPNLIGLLMLSGLVARITRQRYRGES